jgi:hypothetical protein
MASSRPRRRPATGTGSRSPPDRTSDHRGIVIQARLRPVLVIAPAPGLVLREHVAVTAAGSSSTGNAELIPTAPESVCLLAAG